MAKQIKTAIKAKSTVTKSKPKAKAKAAPAKSSSRRSTVKATGRRTAGRPKAR